MQSFSVSHARLMRESADRVQVAAKSANGHEQMIASRILESPATWEGWEREHAVLMRGVANCGDKKSQCIALKEAAFALIHRKALFEFLRDQGVRGWIRARVVAHFRTGQFYHDAIIAEHRVYLRRACSYLCTEHLGLQVLHDLGFIDPFKHYERLFAEYFDLYCRAVCGADGVDSTARMELLPLLKYELKEWRDAILHPTEALPRLLRDAELRRPTGDTQRNRVLSPLPNQSN